ncbi:MAG: MFS transporter, partial [Bacteroidota bacterium]
IGSTLIAGSFLFLPLAVTVGFSAVLVVVLVLTIGEIFYMPFTNTYVSTYAPVERRGEYLGVLSASYSAAFVLCPLISFGIAAEYGYAAAIMACCGFAALGWLLLTRVNAIRSAKSRDELLPKTLG